MKASPDICIDYCKLHVWYSDEDHNKILCCRLRWEENRIVVVTHEKFEVPLDCPYRVEKLMKGAEIETGKGAACQG